MNIDDLIYLQNPWFRDRKFIPKEHTLPHRQLFSKLLDEVTSEKQITALTGLRRTGKSTLVRQIIAQLLIRGAPPEHILYFSFDQPTVEEHKDTLDAIIHLYVSSILRTTLHVIDMPTYVFFDEVQLIPYWQNILKRYYDLNIGIKFVVTGSASLFIGTKSHESLAGRILMSFLPPLAFSEYQTLFQSSDFEQFLTFGQFPEMREIVDVDKKRAYLRESVIGKVLEVDIPTLWGIRKIPDFERLFWSLLPNAGQIIESGRLMTDLKLKKATLFRYLRIFEQSLLISKVLNYSRSFRSEKRLLRKLYPSSSNFLSLTPEAVQRGFFAETYVNSILQSHTKDVFLLRDRDREIDFILPDKRLALEVKYREHVSDKDALLLSRFTKKNNYRGIVITKTQEGARGNITFIPLQSLDASLDSLL